MTSNVLTATSETRRMPMPYPDPELYRSVMEAGFAAYPERKANYQAFQHGTRGEHVDHLPIKLDIEPVSRCNFRCAMCQVSEWPKMQRAADMTIDNYRALLDEQVGLVEIKLQGMGEALLAAEPYFEMIRLARERHIWVRSTTNASLLHLNNNHKKLIDTDICEIQISIDGATKESFEAIRNGGKFDMVTRNAKMLNDYAIQVGKLRTRMWTVVQQRNVGELMRFPALAAELGFARLTLSVDLNDWGQDRWRNSNDQIDVQNTIDPALVDSLVSDGAARGVEVTFWYIDRKYDTGSLETLCPWPFERAYIASDMRVVPCCMISNPDVLEVGSARRLTETWNAADLGSFRRAHIDGKIPDICRTCYNSPTD